MIRLSLAAALLTGAAANGWAQQPGHQAGFRPVDQTTLRPVPTHGTVAPSAPLIQNPQHPGWDLRWRRSPQTAQQPANQQPANQRQSHQSQSPTGLQVAGESPQLQRVGQTAEVAPVNWLSDPRRVDPLATPGELRISAAPMRETARGTTADFFVDPFANDAAPPPSNPATPQGGLELPVPAHEELFPPAANELDGGNQLRGPIEFRAAPPNVEPEAESNPFSLESGQSVLEPPNETSSLGQMLRDNDPGVAQQNRDPATQRPGSSEELPAPAIDSTQQVPRSGQATPPTTSPEQPFANPSQSADAARQGQDAYRPDGSLFEGGTDFLNPKVFTCEDFRKRIAEQTIDRVSLNVSPPFRPDVFDVRDYEELRADFNEKQVVRRWTGIDGRELATGRLRNLAYENVEVEAENGSIQQLPVNRLSEGDIAYVTNNWDLPRECLIDQAAYTPRQWQHMTMTWKASNLCHNPLYFEDVNLERYGHTRGPLLEPIVQSAHFFANIAVLPYKMGVHAPNECQYALGYYRPGNCAPWIKPPMPISARGAIAQAATMTGLFWLIP